VPNRKTSPVFNNMKKIFTLTCILLLLLNGGGLRAQQDTSASIRQFLHVCNAYKHLPIQLEIDIRSSANLVLATSDTARMYGRFVLCQHGSYIVMDSLEQLANDSLMLIVNTKTKRMQLYPNRQSVAARMQQYLGQQLRDSSAIQLTEKYRVSKEGRHKDTATIGLGSRRLLANTGLPLQELELKYDPVTQRPFAVLQLDRSLLPVSDSVYQSAQGQPQWAGRTISIHDSSFFLIREQTRVFYYRTIEHRSETDPPVKISDRVVADLGGAYRPAKAFAAFRLTQQVQ
jgi:hypothetical protein